MTNLFGESELSVYFVSVSYSITGIQAFSFDFYGEHKWEPAFTYP